MSKEVRLLLVMSSDCYECPDVAHNISDWEVISDEDFSFLKNNIHRLSIPKETNGFRYILACKDDVPVISRIESIKEFVRKESDIAAKYEADKKKKAAERRKRKLEEEKALLEKLKKKFEGKE